MFRLGTLKNSMWPSTSKLTSRSRHLSYLKSKSKNESSATKFTEVDIADHSWRQQNHIWTKEEIEARKLTVGFKFKARTLSDRVMQTVMKTMYFSFNAITGYTPKDPSPNSIQWRLIILESFAGVPGFVGAAFRHFYSLRNLRRDHGMIYTLLEEAENERMHLLVCLKMFEASMFVRGLVVAAQFTMTPFLIFTYLIHPPALNRFVGYLEETAVETYANIIDHTEKKGTKLNLAWKNLDAPGIAVRYWQLPNGERKWKDCLIRMMTDEMHHRDVNHTLASLPQGADNPFIREHMEDFDLAAIRRTESILKNVQNQYQVSLEKKEDTVDEKTNCNEIRIK